MPAYVVTCKRKHREGVEFSIPLHCKNSEKICSHCPLRHSCSKQVKMRVKFFEDLRRDITMKLPMGVNL